MREVIETRTAKLWCAEDGSIRVVAHEGADEDQASAEEHVDIIRRLTGGERRPVLIDIRRLRSLERGARLVYSGPAAASYTLVAAMLVDSPLSRILGNFFVGLNRPPFPIRLFSSERDALAWLARSAGAGEQPPDAPG